LRASDSRWTTVVLGGGDRGAASALGARLRAALVDYEFVDDIDVIPPEYRGLHAANPVNRTRSGGVQLELPPRIRGNSPVWAGAPRDEHDFVSVTATLVAELANFARALD
jgi:phage replication-related protein YjqB (UPF0714/DUF867 family)